ncbi:hypothetical protein HIM_04058 [Hirsutella minnesotensis 3608]|uniref:Cell wall proline rich protein n=1 Tax=Hirsutella minnesotensis 3608 TaxID=1043627 RepID=A0A0F8A250_9HYPO|nr:hypothetical protein HIM_04058 [Hirsutella minnesotensis 3608]
MATTRSPAWAAATSATSVHSMNETLGHRLHVESPNPPRIVAEESTGSEPPPPNPPFTFPARMALPAPTPAINTPVNARRPMSAIEPQRFPSPSPENGDRPRRGHALPAFSFNPGAQRPQDLESSFLSPPITPSSSSPRPFPSPSRPPRHGHRRGGSEFVGGSIRDGNSIAVMSTSPTKSESGFASSPGLAPPSRRHRRGLSGVISMNDLPLLQPLPGFLMPKGNSAPNSPTTFDIRADNHFPIPDQAPISSSLGQADDKIKVHDISTTSMSLPTTPAAMSSASSSPKQPRLGRARVGFSDKLEFIPRPLSLVSSDTSSTATARPGHSVSGSISSVVSISSPGGSDSPVSLSRSPPRPGNDLRPSTAGAVLERMAAAADRENHGLSHKRRNSIASMLNLVDSQCANQVVPEADAKAPKRWSFFGLDHAMIGTVAPLNKVRPSSSSSSESASKVNFAPSSSDQDSDSTETGRDGQGASVQPSKMLSTKKLVKGWAGSILPRKPKGHKKKADSTRPPTPPASVDPLEEDDNAYSTEETLDSVTPSPESPVCQVFNPEVAAPLTAMDVVPKADVKDDSSYQMIDLDAALGPFNTPLPLNPEWEAAQRAGGSTGKKRMHSAQGMKGFSGPGMHYHRRSESAPDLPPFESARTGIHRFNSNSTMADVFEEDEDEDGGVSSSQPTDSEASASKTRSDDPAEVALAPPTLPMAGSGSSRNSPNTTASAGFRRAASEPLESEKPILPPSTPLQDDFDQPPSIIFCTANAGGLDPVKSSPKRLPGAKDLTPVEVFPVNHYSAAVLPASPYSTSHASSSHPSPRSPMSIDAQHISTAPSSITDKNSFQSLLMGEPGPEVRISVDYDIRSFTSSNSTMTRDSSFLPSQRMSQPSLRDQRPVSVSSAAFGRRRSSLVSLSRLISSAHGERSKLSMEVTLDNEPESKKARSKSSKTKQRLGRMMQFWKLNKNGNASTG